MSLHQFFLDDQVISNNADEVFVLRLSEEDVKHASVLRLMVGEHVAIVDAQGVYYECEIVSTDNNRIKVRVCTRSDDKEPDCSITLIQGIPKSDKFEEIIRHCTELGVSSFAPLKCSRSISKLTDDKAAKKLSRWHSIAKSAAMQSGMRVIPSIHQPMGIDEVADLVSESDLCIVFWEEADPFETVRAVRKDYQDRRKTDRPSKPLNISIVVGPEGGLESAEVDKLASMNPYTYIATLGSGILRCETAAIVASALTSYEFNG